MFSKTSVLRSVITIILIHLQNNLTMKIRLAILVFALSILFSTSGNTQEFYNSAVGLRLGYPASVTYKTFLNDESALEAYAGLRSWSFGSFFNISGAYQVHKPIDEVDGLQWYYGGGASVYFWTYDDIFLDRNYSSTSFGVQGYLGLDYTFEDAPINLTLDWVPSFFFGGSLNIDTFGVGYGSLAVRYVLNR